MKDAAKHAMARKSELDGRKNIHDVADEMVKGAEKTAKEQGKEYTREDANRDRRNALLAMQGINRED